MKPKVFYLTAYIKDRVYGGPEEGGWWYDTYTPIMSIKTKGKQAIKGNNYSFIPLKSDKKAREFMNNNNGFVIYSEARKYENRSGYQYYC